MLVADLLLTMSVYVLLPVMPQWLMGTENFTPFETGLSMGVFGLGLYLFGSYCSWLVERYRRNMVCMWAVLALAADMGLLWYLDGRRSEFAEFGVVMLQRLLLGATFGLAQMVLSSTLIIDTCESHQRTEANHSAAWFARFALALGPLSGLVVSNYYGFSGVVLTAIGCALAAVVLIKMVTFPFRAPEEDVHMASFDRFLLPHGHVLFLNLLPVSTVTGLVLALPLAATFYVWLMGGFVLALLAQHFVFRDAELKSEVVSGLLLLLAGLLALTVSTASAQEPVGVVTPLAPVVIGLGLGLVGARFLLFFIKLSRHCKRGTSQSTFFLGWETGLAIGLCLGYAVFFHHSQLLLNLCIVLTLLSLLMYHFYTHAWFVEHKNR